MTSVRLQGDFCSSKIWFFLLCRSELRTWFPNLFAHLFSQETGDGAGKRRHRGRTQFLSSYLYLKFVVLNVAAYRLDAELILVLSKSLFAYLQWIAYYKIFLGFLCCKNACATPGRIASRDLMMGTPQCSISQCPCSKGLELRVADVCRWVFGFLFPTPLLVLLHLVFLVAKCCRDSFFN